MLATGIWTLVDKSFINELLRNDLYMTPAYVLVVSGLLITLLSLFGCFGAIKKVKCLLLTYFALAFCTFMVLLIAGVLGYVFREQVSVQIDLVNGWSGHREGFCGCRLKIFQIG